MPLYMDIHTVESETFTVEDVVKAHMQDLAIQDRFGVTQIKYWVNVEAKTLFCLMEGPNKEACNAVHKESHGNTACNIIEVSDDEFNLFLGEGKSKNDLAFSNLDEIDTGYRTILLLSIADFTGKKSTHLNEIRKIFVQHNGAVIIQPEEDLMVSFIYAKDAIVCSLAINNKLKSIGHKIEFSLALSSGKPVDEKGSDLFEETKNRVKHLCDFGMRKTIYLDSATKALADKESMNSTIKHNSFKIIKNQDFLFLFQLYDILNHKLFEADFKSEDFNELLRLSKSQTYRKIKSLTGFAPNQLIQEIRLRKSLKKLKEKGCTISEVAFDLGFNSPTYFTRIFRKRFNITPSSFTHIS